MNQEEIIRTAAALGFSDAAFIPVSDLVVVPEYRKYCEMNLCHCYNVNPACPPICGSVEEMIKKISRHSHALILQTKCGSTFSDDPEGAKAAKHTHNLLADQLILQIFGKNSDADFLRMSAGPWKHFSCMSAYCVDAQKMADAARMTCWADDGKTRFFSLLLF